MHSYSVVLYVRVMCVLVSADDMGLGKTLTMIALVLKTKEEIETEGVSREDADDIDEENESSLYSEKRTCKYYFTFPRHFHFLQLCHLSSSQSIYILPEFTNVSPCSSIQATPLRLTSSYLAS
jgi:SNF2 family N-terminal domain.